jgi:hypothetical protein
MEIACAPYYAENIMPLSYFFCRPVTSDRHSSDFHEKIPAYFVGNTIITCLYFHFTNQDIISGKDIFNKYLIMLYIAF